MPESLTLTECVQYFKTTPGFARLFEKMREKYVSLGNLGGTIHLDNLSPDEQEALTGFLRKDFYNKKNAAIKVEKLAEALQHTRFEEFSLEAVLKEYFSGDIVSVKEEAALYEVRKQKFFANLMNGFEYTRAVQWLDHVLTTRQNAYNLIIKSFNEDSTVLRESLATACRALNTLPVLDGKTVRLAIFSSEICKNPHALDYGTLSGNLLMYGIAYMTGSPFPSNAEERAELLYQAGIISDEISNYTVASGLLAMKDGIKHNGWKGFYDNKEPLMVSLCNIASIDRIVSPSGKVYIFENPAVFSHVLHKSTAIHPSLLCTSGQVKLASLALMDKLVKSSCTLFYSGDFDPEGLLIADRLKLRYGDKLVLWKYGVENYQKIKSSQVIDPSRLKKMEKLQNPELKLLAEAIMSEGVSAYQELLVEDYLEDILL